MRARRPPEPGAAPHPPAELAGYTSQHGGWCCAPRLELENSGSCSTSRFPILSHEARAHLEPYGTEKSEDSSASFARVQTSLNQLVKSVVTSLHAPHSHPCKNYQSQRGARVLVFTCFVPCPIPAPRRCLVHSRHNPDTLWSSGQFSAHPAFLRQSVH